MMKQLILFFLIFSINKSCSQSVDSEQAFSSATYSAITRGSSYSCSIDKENIKIESNGTVTESEIKSISPEDWRAINDLVGSISLNNIPNFKAPTNDSAFDGARMAGVVIEANGKVYESMSFDEGNPPNELKALVDLMLVLAETVE